MEGRRVLTSRLFLAVLAGLVVLNCFFFLCQRPDGQVDQRAYGEEYHGRLEALSQYSWEEALQWCKDYQQAEQDRIASGEWVYDLDKEREKAIVVELQSQYGYLLGYGGYLDQIDRQAKLLQSVSLFADPDSAAYKNTVKTAEDFSALKGVEVSAGHDRAVTVFFEDKWTDYSILILIFVVCGAFVAERKEGLWPMIHAASGGRSRLALRRIGILLAASWIATVVLVGMRILLCGWAYHGLGEWGRALQSIPMFQNVPTPLTVGQFWLVYLAVKAMGAFWIGLVLWAILSAISNLALALGAAGLVLGVEFACTAIPSSSMFAAARYINVFSFIDFIGVFTRYLNLTVFGHLISGCDLVLLLLPVLCVVFMAVVILIAQRKRPVSVVNRLLRWLDGIVKKLDPHLAGGGEVRKLLIRRRGIVMLILLLMVVSRMEAAPRAYVAWDPFVQHYQQQYAGLITEEKLERMQAALESGIDLNNQKGLSIVLEDARNAPSGSWIVHSAPYEAVWNDNEENYQRDTALMVLLFLTLILAPIASQERQNDMTILLNSTPGGREKLMRRKHLLLLSLTALIWAIVYGTELVRIVQEYGAFTGLSAPAFSLALFRNAGWSVPIWLVMALYYGAKLLVMVAVGEVCFCLSSYCSKNRDAMLLCCGVIVIPAALAAIGSAIGEYLSFLLPLGGAEVLWRILG